MTGNSTPEKDKAVDTTSTSEGNTTDTTDKNTQVDTTSKAEGDKAKVFTQEEVNKLIGETRQTVRDAATKKALGELLEKVGVSTPEELTTLVTEAKTLKEQSLSEAEKTKLALEQASKKVETLAQEKEQAEALARETAIKAEIAKVAGAKFEDTDVVLRLIERESIKIDDEGTVQGVSEAVEALGKKYPWMLKRSNTQSTSTANPSGRTVAPSRDDKARNSEYFGMQNSEFWQGGGVKKILETD